MRRRLLLLAGLPLNARAAAMKFPRDFGAHRDAPLEWWYLTGILSGADGLPLFGYQLTFFRLKGPAPGDHPSRFAARQLLLGHAALSDLRGGKLHHDQRIARAGMGLNEASETDCEVHMRDWSLRRTTDGYEARLRAADFALDLSLKTTQPVLLQGQEGRSQKGPAQFSNYYSQVQLSTTAVLKFDGREQRLQGRSWLDHEWSEQLLAPQAVGWDWLGINLDDGSALTLFQLRRADGTPVWAGGSWRSTDGRDTHNFAPERIRMTALRRWRSPASGAEYPVEWRLETPRGTFRLKALIDAQEVDARASAGMRYWEGASLLTDEKNSRLGAGYLELTGYAGAMRLPT